MAKLATALMNEARRVARLQTRVRTLKRDLAAASAELRQAKKNLRALADSTADPFEQAPPLRMFGERAASSRGGSD